MTRLKKKEKKNKMKKIALIVTLMIFNMNLDSFAGMTNCNNFKKFSVEFFKCKGNLVKDKTMSAGQNIIKDTKNFQNKEWSKEKEKIIKTKEKVLNQWQQKQI
mgnify:CR=1 FL=1